MPSHQDRVRQNNCNHAFVLFTGLRQVPHGMVVLGGAQCFKCGKIYSRLEYDEFKKRTVHK